MDGTYTHTHSRLWEIGACSGAIYIDAKWLCLVVYIGTVNMLLFSIFFKFLLGSTKFYFPTFFPLLFRGVLDEKKGEMCRVITVWGLK
jgi:hypothetical protein